MLKLHLDKETFKQFINKINAEANIDTDILEKDYYVCCILEELSKKQDYLKAYFKGGTAIYKILDTMNRFSEDIDLTKKVLKDQSNTQNRKMLKQSALGYSVDGLTLVKEECVDNKGSVTGTYKYDTVFSTEELPLHRAGRIQVESTSFTVSEPIESYKIEPIIYKLANKDERKILKKQYDVSEIDLNIIKLERIFVDKLFAAEFYYIRDMYTDVAKHLYDITILYNNRKIQELLNNEKEFKKLIEYKREEETYRKGGIDKSLKMQNFTYLKADFNNELMVSFDNMQDKYILNERYKIKLEETIKLLNEINLILKKYNF